MRPTTRRRGGLASRGAAALLLALLLLPASLPAQDFEGRVVRKIKVVTTPRLDPMRVLEMIRTREGDLYSNEAVEKDIERLYKLGHLVDITIVPSLLADGGVLLTVSVKEPAVVTRVRFEGDIRVGLSDLKERLQVTKSKYADAYQLSLDESSLRDYLREEGYIHATVRRRLVPNPKGVELVYAIDSGPRERIENIAFTGNKSIDADELRGLMATKARFYVTPGAYDPDVFRSDLGVLRDHYRGLGWLDAVVGYRLAQDDTMQRLFITVIVREGHRYRLDGVTVRGNRLFTRDEIKAVMKQRPGKWYEPVTVEKDRQRIRDLYGKQGHINATVTARATVIPETRRATLSLLIAEKQTVYLNEIKIFGNRRTQDHVIRRNLAVLPGHRADSVALERSVRRLRNTGLFQATDPTAVGDPVRMRFQPTDDPEVTNAVIELIEGRLGDITVGAGYNSNAGVVGEFRVRHDNFDWSDFPKSWSDFWSGDAFAGGAQTLTLALSPGQNISDYRLRWHNPSFDDGPYSGGFDLFWRDYVYEKYDDTRKGIALEVGREVLPDLRLSLIPLWEDIYIHNIHKNDEGRAPEDLERVRGHNQKHALTLRATLDKRNDRFLPTRGYSVTASVGLSGGVLGGDVKDLKERVRASKWWTVFKDPEMGAQVLHVRGEVGFIQALNSSGHVPIFERYFCGGLGSVRGFRRRGIGPYDEEFDYHRGGKFLMVGNVEYFVPIFRQYVQLVLFTDVGKVSNECSLEDLRVGSGLGLRFRIPQLGGGRVPLVLDFGYPVVKQSTDETQNFFFSMGSVFSF